MGDKRPLTAAETKEFERLQREAAKSRKAGFRLDAWAFAACAQDILDAAAGKKTVCRTCGRSRL